MSRTYTLARCVTCPRVRALEKEKRELKALLYDNAAVLGKIAEKKLAEAKPRITG